MTLSITETLPVVLPEEPEVRIYCVTDPEKPLRVSGVLRQSVAQRRMERMARVLRQDTYDLLPVSPTEKRR